MQKRLTGANISEDSILVVDTLVFTMTQTILAVYRIYYSSHTAVNQKLSCLRCPPVNIVRFGGSDSVRFCIGVPKKKIVHVRFRTEPNRSVRIPAPEDQWFPNSENTFTPLSSSNPTRTGFPTVLLGSALYMIGPAGLQGALTKPARKVLKWRRPYRTGP